MLCKPNKYPLGTSPGCDTGYGMEGFVMEKESFFSGYCRQIDGSRMVAAVAENKTLTEVDCCYPDCPYTTECTIAQKITEFLQQN